MTTLLFAGGGTGGHLMPALAIAQATNAIRPEWQMVFAGAQRGIEAQVLPARGVPHHLLPLEPIYRQQWWKNLRWPLRAVGLIRQIDQMLDRVAPAAVIGTGGYVSGPVVWRAARRGIPTGILDLDVQPGIATRWLAPSVNEIWLAAPEALAKLKPRVQPKARVIGAPIIPPDRSLRAAAFLHFGLNPSRLTLVMIGGSQGSLAINQQVSDWLATGGLGEAQLIWATGKQGYADFAAHQQPGRVVVVPFIDPMAQAWAVADLAVTRSGMMTLAELSAWGIPSLLIPLPTAAADHQTLNARAQVGAGAGILLPQAGLTTLQFGAEINRLLRDPTQLSQMGHAALRRGKPDAAQALALRVAALAALPSRLS